MQSNSTSLGLLAGFLALAGAAAPALATEDTDTPGAGRWEINLIGSATRSTGKVWEFGLPEVEINYGVGDRLQLMLAGSRIRLDEPGMPVRSGTGSATTGFKWRLLDQEDAGFSLAVFPQYTWNPSKGAERSGIVEPGTSTLLPFIVGLKRGATGVYAEIGRSFETGGGREWARGVKVLNQCRENVECRVELTHELVSSTGHQTTISTGFKWALNDTYVVVAGIGRDVGRRDEGARGVMVNLGVQILK
jgi:hypothetical protein